MQFEVNRAVLLEAARNAAKVAPSHSSAEILNGILVESNEDTGEVFLTATNHESSIQQKVRASVARSGAMLVEPRMLVGMLSLLAGDFTGFQAVNKTTLKVSGGRCIYEIVCKSAADYPRPVMPFPEETAQLTGICSIAKRTVFATSKDENRPAAQCVNVRFRRDNLHAAACDGAKLMMVKEVGGANDERELFLPARPLQMLASISKDSDVFDVGDTGKEVVFVRGDMLFSMKYNSSGRVDMGALVKSISPAFSAVADSRDIREKLDFVSTGATDEEIAGKRVNLAFYDGSLYLSRLDKYSEANAELSAKVSKPTPEAGFYYLWKDLQKLFQIISGKVKIEIDERGKMLIKTRNEVYLQVPLRAPTVRAQSVREDEDKNESYEAYEKAA